MWYNKLQQGSIKVSSSHQYSWRPDIVRHRADTGPMRLVEDDSCLLLWRFMFPGVYVNRLFFFFNLKCLTGNVVRQPSNQFKQIIFGTGSNPRVVVQPAARCRISAFHCGLHMKVQPYHQHFSKAETHLSRHSSRIPSHATLPVSHQSDYFDRPATISP